LGARTEESSIRKEDQKKNIDSGRGGGKTMEAERETTAPTRAVEPRPNGIERLI